MTRAKPMTIAESTAAARSFIAYVTNPDREWTLATIEAHMPSGWVLRDGVIDSDFFPLTVANVARAIRSYARRA